jgi:hypothetical protein
MFSTNAIKIFYLKLIESIDVEPMDMEDQLNIYKYYILVHDTSLGTMDIVTLSHY